MLGLTLWSGMLPRQRESQLKVYSKLSGAFLGVLDRPSLPTGQAYQVLRLMQDQIAKMFVHHNRPPRYMVLMANNVCLTSPSFMFVRQYSSTESKKVYDLLAQASRLDVFYNEDDSYALDMVDRLYLDVEVNESTLSVFNKPRNGVPGTDFRYHEFLPPELEVFGLRAAIESIVTHHPVHALDPIALFPELKRLYVCGPVVGCVDFASLEHLKCLVDLHLLFSCELDTRFDLVQNLRVLSLDAITTTSIPTEIGFLTNLTRLDFVSNFGGSIPHEIKKCQKLKHLGFENTNITQNIPGELFDIAALESLSFVNNHLLKGCLPKEFDTHQGLNDLCLRNTSLDVGHRLDSWQNVGYQHWAR